KRNVTTSAWCNSLSRGCCKNRRSCYQSRAHRRSRISKRTWLRRNSSSLRTSGRGSKVWDGHTESCDPVDQNHIAAQLSVVRAIICALFSVRDPARTIERKKKEIRSKNPESRGSSHAIIRERT